MLPRRLPAASLALLVSLAGIRSAAAQTPVPLELPPAHPARELVELHHALFGGHAPALEVGSFREGDLARLGAASEVWRLWGSTFQGGSALAPALVEGGDRTSGAAVLSVGRHAGQNVLEPRAGVFGMSEGGLRLGNRVAGRVAGGWGPPGATHRVHESNVMVRAGGTVLTLGRFRTRLGPGADDLLFSGARSLDGVRASNVRSFRLPGVLRRTGGWNASAALARPGRVGVVDDPWYGMMAVSVDPVPALRLGAARTAVFGGTGRPAVTFRRVAGMIAGRHSTDAGEFEDQYAQLFFRARIPVADRGVVFYGAFAVNDTEGAWRDDPAVLTGLLLPLAPGGWPGGFRYEYQAFGSRARPWSTGTEGRPRTWFNHYVFGEHLSDLGPFGSTLGGYGARHLLRWTGWSPDARWELGVEGTAEVRERMNLFVERWPGKRRGALVRAAFHPVDVMRIEARFGVAGGPDLPARGSFEIIGHWNAFRFPDTHPGDPR